jgi:hypothetical protein
LIACLNSQKSLRKGLKEWEEEKCKVKGKENSKGEMVKFIAIKRRNREREKEKGKRRKERGKGKGKRERRLER